MDEKISVIMPVYNVERYLRKSIDSVLQQDYKNIELILIDDGSTDNSGRICDEYAHVDKRVVVIHQQNRGAAAAKNAGLKIASGSLLSFVDSDDYLENNVYMYMTKLMKENNAQMIQCAFRYIYADCFEDQIIKPGRRILSAKDFIKLFVTDWTCALLWDKLFQRQLFDNIYFNEGHIIDDEFFTYKGIINAQSIICDDKIIYNYRKRSSSVMNSARFNDRTLLDRIDYLTERRHVISQTFPDLRGDFDENYLNALILFSSDENVTTRVAKRIKRELLYFLLEKKYYKPSIGIYYKIISIIFHKKKTHKKYDLLQENEDHFFD